MEARRRVTPGGGAGRGDPAANPRESATETRPPESAPARVKRWGKSPPRCRQRRRHGKPRREQGQIGTTGRKPGTAFGPSSGWTARGRGRPRSQMNGHPRNATRCGTEPGLQAVRSSSCQQSGKREAGWDEIPPGHSCPLEHGEVVLSTHACTEGVAVQTTAIKHTVGQNGRKILEVGQSGVYKLIQEAPADQKNRQFHTGNRRAPLNTRT